VRSKASHLKILGFLEDKTLFIISHITLRRNDWRKVMMTTTMVYINLKINGSKGFLF
jgi:hypothetical protein